jgi:1-aminocyclopropane-1-carboxylate deaminase/D-cysteine desulfhydrase-like pyridoxal-dependent ACC family enzyme
MPKGRMTKEQRQKWKPYSKILEGNITKEHYKTICELHADLYAHPYEEPCSCSPTKIKSWIVQIDEVYEARDNT